jgi:hypothetical protein
MPTGRNMTAEACWAYCYQNRFQNLIFFAGPTNFVETTTDEYTSVGTIQYVVVLWVEGTKK